MKKKTKTKLYGSGNIKDVCTARNGQRCKECRYYGIICTNWMKFHHMTKPCDYDVVKHDIMKVYYSGNTHANNATRTRGEKNHGNFKKEYHRKKGY